MTPGFDTNGEKPLTLRPASALWIPTVTWAVIAFLLVDAIIKNRWDTVLQFGPWLGLAAFLVWLILFSPATLVYPAGVVVRNVFHEYSAPYAAIDHIGLGVMVSIRARTESGTTRTVTAWNAPGIGRDKPADAHVRISGRDRYADRGHVGPAERLRNDRERSPSRVLVHAWEAWQVRHEKDSDAGPGTGVLHTKLRIIPLAIPAAFLILGILTSAL
ncbi:hypothetical protein DAD186_03460 [Dermabacter vaginalis]|uniref:PH domain-containing protein n=1 Tax=Dermabacter vaginalis TaxID=1630135 RepID=A0A1B0ZG43_9MICO|nr:hypothetical protein [Dermabacter vaginalis]ANP26903.1 hypothetical protein DAD186_03460 [Dermabacter vaginalis]